MLQLQRSTNYEFMIATNHSIILDDPEGKVSDIEIHQALVDYVNAVPHLRHHANINRKSDCVEIRFNLSANIPEGTTHYKVTSKANHCTLYTQTIDFYRLWQYDMLKYFFEYNTWLRVEPIKTAKAYSREALETIYKFNKGNQ